LVALGNTTIEVSVEDCRDGAVRFTASGLQRTARFFLSDGILHLELNGMVAAVRETTHEPTGAARRESSSRLLAPMNGAIIGVFAQVGDPVARGQRIVVLEAMKMQHEISAERDGIIDKVLVKVGDQVATRQLLVELKQEESATRDRAEEQHER
jgi:geranyl-CoA carboxylase alpha subunit